jgi:hypothetical protein
MNYISIIKFSNTVTFTAERIPSATLCASFGGGGNIIANIDNNQSRVKILELIQNKKWDAGAN